jgi:hypothetical protein
MIVEKDNLPPFCLQLFSNEMSFANISDDAFIVVVGL